MKQLLRVISILKTKCQKAWQLFSCLLQILFTNRAIVLGTPFHDNIGDSAIVISEGALLKKAGYPGYIDVTTKVFLRWSRVFQRFISTKRPLFIHGGGNMGDLWDYEEKMRREVLTCFPDNPIICFPQTLFYADPQKEAESVAVYSTHKNLILTAREQVSYEKMVQLYPNTKVLLTPDAVLYTEMKDFGAAPKTREGVLICARSDDEKCVDAAAWERIERVFAQRGTLIRKTDMYYNGVVTPKNRKECIRQKMEEFCSAKLVVTDRLHGMVFAALTGTPCVALSNYNHKVRGTYAWIRNLPSVQFAESTEQALEAIHFLLSDIDSRPFTWHPLERAFDELVLIVSTNREKK